MSGLTPLRQVQLAELDLAKKFVKFCDEHHLRYYMLGGTFLGAIRHQGFIPWDDDMDFGMFREDYERFISIYQEQSCDFELFTYKNDIDSLLFHNRIRLHIRLQDPASKIKVSSDSWMRRTCLPWVDVFPLDGFPKNRIFRDIWKYYLLWRRATVRYSVFSKCLTLERPGRPLIERILIRLGRFLPVEKIFHVEKELQKLDKASKRFSNPGSDYLINVEGAYKLREMFPKQVFGEGAFYEFEGLSLCGPRDYYTYLTQLYGDFMTPPSTDDIERNHHFLSTIEIEE